MLEPIVQTKIEGHLLAGMKPKRIREEFHTDVPIAEIYAVAQQLRKAGKLEKAKQAAPKTARRKGRKKTTSAKARMNEFISAVEGELNHCDIEIERLGRLAAAYDKTNSEFAAHVEKQIESKRRQKEALEDYLKG